MTRGNQEFLTNFPANKVNEPVPFDVEIPLGGAIQPFFFPRKKKP
jgi:hypothetical protein